MSVLTHCNRERSSIQDLWYHFNHQATTDSHTVLEYSAPAEMATSSARITCAEQILRSAQRSHASQTRSYRTRRTIPWAARGARAMKASDPSNNIWNPLITARTAGSPGFGVQTCFVSSCLISVHKTMTSHIRRTAFCLSTSPRSTSAHGPPHQY